MKIAAEVLCKLDQLTLACSEIQLRKYRNEALIIIQELRHMVRSITETQTVQGLCDPAPFKAKTVADYPPGIEPYKKAYLNEPFYKIKKNKEVKVIVDKPGETKDILLRQIQACNLTFRTENCLKSNKIFYVGDLVEKTEDELLTIKNFGRTCLNEVQDFLSEDGLQLKCAEVSI